ncbi:MAG: hypothetical protein ACLR2E_04330 [Lachnospiraceae bacterium]
MSRLCVFMLPLALDYSGAASAPFDLGGIVVVCTTLPAVNTGNFTGYDEPRWMGFPLGGLLLRPSENGRGAEETMKIHRRHPGKPRRT